jgi:hypothetical protein
LTHFSVRGNRAQFLAQLHHTDSPSALPPPNRAADSYPRTLGQGDLFMRKPLLPRNLGVPAHHVAHAQSAILEAHAGIRACHSAIPRISEHPTPDSVRPPNAAALSLAPRKPAGF